MDSNPGASRARSALGDALTGAGVPERAYISTWGIAPRCRTATGWKRVPECRPRTLAGGRYRRRLSPGTSSKTASAVTSGAPM
jgi:hypothetical protein